MNNTQAAVKTAKECRVAVRSDDENADIPAVAVFSVDEALAQKIAQRAALVMASGLFQTEEFNYRVTFLKHDPEEDPEAAAEAEADEDGNEVRTDSDCLQVSAEEFCWRAYLKHTNVEIVTERQSIPELLAHFGIEPVGEGSDSGMVAVPRAVLSGLLAMGEAHVEDIDSGIEDGTYDAAENPDIEQKRAVVEAARALVGEVADSDALAEVLPGATREEIADVMMQDLVGNYETPETVPEWAWVEQNASFVHAQNGRDGIWEFIPNLSRHFENIPEKLVSAIADAQSAGKSYLVIHQGT